MKPIWTYAEFCKIARGFHESDFGHIPCTVCGAPSKHGDGDYHYFCKEHWPDGLLASEIMGPTAQEHVINLPSTRMIHVNQAWKDARYELQCEPDSRFFKNPYPYRFATSEDCAKATAALQECNSELFLSLTVAPFIETT